MSWGFQVSVQLCNSRFIRRWIRKYRCASVKMGIVLCVPCNASQKLVFVLCYVVVDLQGMLCLQSLMAERLSQVWNVTFGHVVAQDTRQIAIFTQPSLLELELEAALVH